MLVALTMVMVIPTVSVAIVLTDLLTRKMVMTMCPLSESVAFSLQVSDGELCHSDDGDLTCSDVI